MDVKCLEAKHHVDSETGCRYRYIFSADEYFRLHNHDFFEMFLTLDGDITHIVNNKKQNLKAGSLVFVRPSDVHIYEYNQKQNYTFVNLTFTKETAEILFEYLSDGFAWQELLSQELPPFVLLDRKEKLRLLSKFEDLNNIRYQDKKQLKLKVRILLVEIFTRYFTHIKEGEASNIPYWLETVCEQMKKQKNFAEGTAKMVELSGKSREHVVRSIKKHYGITSTEFINDIRLNYIANMLLNSNAPILDLCFESGFQNVSWFYTLFKKKYGMSPNGFRNSAH